MKVAVAMTSFVPETAGRVRCPVPACVRRRKTLRSFGLNAVGFTKGRHGVKREPLSKGALGEQPVLPET